ncbi:MAG TPA: YbhB/YbcL family Raf kinase inhibitor-like protein [Terriglobales bacterium]|nr:YbhB/YbcL family Raf kinase inhibitor-like protein [Terriglobales bacterium]
MAQRTGAKRLLALWRKAASAGVTPALAVVVTGALVGCAGGSGETTASSPRAPGPAAEGSSEGKRVDGQASTRKVRSSSESKDSSAGEGAAPGAGKHGTRIAPPKGPREKAPTAEEEAQATVANITLASPSLPPGAGGVAPLSPVYTCDGKDGWPALSWQGVPPGTAELALFAMNVQPVGGDLFFDWAVAGIDPALSGIDASRLPRGAVVGQNSFEKRGYSICPAAGSSETYMFALYALPKRLAPERGFDPDAFRQQVLAISGSAGFFPVSYVRG